MNYNITQLNLEIQNFKQNIYTCLICYSVGYHISAYIKRKALITRISYTCISYKRMLS
jgi:hypothetical protein